MIDEWVQFWEINQFDIEQVSKNDLQKLSVNNIYILGILQQCRNIPRDGLDESQGDQYGRNALRGNASL